MDTKKLASDALYYGGQLYGLGSDVQGIGYQLMGLKDRLDLFGSTQVGAQELIGLAGNAARLRSQLDYLLDFAERVAYDIEKQMPKGNTGGR
jgi:hypothetical protein